MKKSKYVNLVLISAMLSTAACSTKEEKPNKHSRLHLRSDTTAAYTHSYYPYRYHSFSPVGIYSFSHGRPVYRSTGYESYSTPHSSTARTSSISRGVYGRSAMHVSSGVRS